MKPRDRNWLSGSILATLVVLSSVFARAQDAGVKTFPPTGRRRRHLYRR